MTKFHAPVRRGLPQNRASKRGTGANDSL